MNEVPPAREPEPDLEPEDVLFEPTGLDLARQIADAAGHAVPLSAQPRTPKRRRREPRDPGRSKGDPMSLGQALEGVIERRGWTKQVNVHLLLGRWPELVGETVAEHSTPESYRDTVLVVRTSSTSWASQLRLMAPQLVAKMNEALGEGTVTKVQVLGPEAPSWKHGIRSVPGRGPRDTYG